MATQEASSVLVDDRTMRLIRRELGIEPLVEPEFDFTTIDLTSRRQVRDTNEAPKEQVEAYTWMMDEGDVFPSVVVCTDPDDDTSEPVLTDGNTRTRAHRNRGDRYGSAIIIPLNYHAVDDTTRAKIDYIGGALNAKNGRPNSKSERDMLIRNGIKAGKADKEIATTAGVSPQTVANSRDRALAIDRMRVVGLDRAELPHLKETAVSRFGKADDLPDPVFAKTVKLANDAGMNATDVTSLVNSVRKAPPEDAEDRIERAREEWKPRIEEIRRGNGTGQKPLAGQLRRSLGFITKNPASTFIERNADHAADHEQLVHLAIERLNEVLDEQRKVNADLRARIEAGFDAGTDDDGDNG